MARERSSHSISTECCWISQCWTTSFIRDLGDGRVRREWFSEVLKLALAITAAGGYESFSDIAQAALKLIEDRHERQLSRRERKNISEGMRELLPFPDVKPGLRRLHSHGFRLIVLTNSGERAAKQAVESAGLNNLFEKVLSAESVSRLKPAPAPYRMAAKKSHVKIRDLLLVVAHSWDVGGAKRAVAAPLSYDGRNRSSTNSRPSLT